MSMSPAQTAVKIPISNLDLPVNPGMAGSVGVGFSYAQVQKT